MKSLKHWSTPVRRQLQRLLAAALIVASCQAGSQATAASPSSRCLPATQAQVEPIREGVRRVHQEAEIAEAFAVMSVDFEHVWMVAAVVLLPGGERKSAVWAVTEDSPPFILSVDVAAAELSPYPDNFRAGVSIENDGAREAEGCARAAAPQESADHSSLEVRPAPAQGP